MNLFEDESILYIHGILLLITNYQPINHNKK